MHFFIITFLCLLGDHIRFEIALFPPPWKNTGIGRGNIFIESPLWSIYSTLRLIKRQWQSPGGADNYGSIFLLCSKKCGSHLNHHLS